MAKELRNPGHCPSRTILNTSALMVLNLVMRLVLIAHIKVCDDNGLICNPNAELMVVRMSWR